MDSCATMRLPGVASLGERGNSQFRRILIRLQIQDEFVNHYAKSGAWQNAA
jgi:hypothetical protein